MSLLTGEYPDSLKLVKGYSNSQGGSTQMLITINYQPFCLLYIYFS